MKYSKFCEKEFEILFCREFLNKNNCCDFYFPSQRKEVRKGFDARFKGKKFKAKIYQFKVVHEYSRNPFGNNERSFGFETHAHNGTQKQHNTLVKLNNKGLRAGYAVPCFIDRQSLINYTRSNTLIDNCLYLIPKHDLSPRCHIVKFDTTPYAEQFCNNPEPIQIDELFSLQNCAEISYNEFCESLQLREGNNFFDFLTSNNLLMFYKILD